MANEVPAGKKEERGDLALDAYIEYLVTASEGKNFPRPLVCKTGHAATFARKLLHTFNTSQLKERKRLLKIAKQANHFCVDRALQAEKAKDYVTAQYLMNNAERVYEGLVTKMEANEKRFDLPLPSGEEVTLQEDE